MRGKGFLSIQNRKNGTGGAHDLVMKFSGGVREGVCCSCCGNEGTDCLCFLFLLVMGGGETGCLLKFAPINGGLFALDDESRG